MVYMTMENLDIHTEDKEQLVGEVIRNLESDGYEVEEVNTSKPWGAYVRLANQDADRFIEQYFKGVTPQEARLGVDGLELSPKILVVTPGQRLSWQYHHRRAERWTFLTKGGFYTSTTDEEGLLHRVNPGYNLQIECGERHRLVGDDHDYTVVAEIWQHVNKELPSNEDDIIRLQDDYQR